MANASVTTPKIADKAVVKGKLSEDLQKVLDNAGTKAIRINYDDVEAAKKAIADYNADPNKTVVLVNYSGIRIPAIVSDTYNPVIVAYLPEGINVHKLLFQGDAWSETVIYGDNVRYNKQTLTAAQKAQARQNIGALSSADGAVGNDNIADGAVTNDKICSEAITIDKLELDLEAMVSDNVKYRKQNLTTEQKAQARKNIDVDYLTEDEVANLWDIVGRRADFNNDFNSDFN